MKVTKSKRGSNWGPVEVRKLISWINEQSAQGVSWRERSRLWKTMFGIKRSEASLRAQFTRIKNGWYPKNYMRCLSEGITSDFTELTNSAESPRQSIASTPEAASEAYPYVKEERHSIWSVPNSPEPCRDGTAVRLPSPPPCESTPPSCTNMASPIVSRPKLLVSCLESCRSTARFLPTLAFVLTRQFSKASL